jgi:hypothetical protein
MVGNSIKMLMVLFLVFAVGSPMAAFAEDLSPAQVKTLEGAGVILYPGATYTTGDDEIATTMWFKSKDSPEKIMDWYKGKLSGWSEMEVNGSRIAYKGSGKIEAKDLNNRAYLWARTTDESGVSTDSEITIRIPK